MTTPEFNNKILIKITAIEAEMKNANAWSNQPFNKKLLDNMGAFGGKTMPFEYWLQFVFIPNVRKIIKNKDTFPHHSQVATYASKELEGRPEYNHLLLLLYEFDQLFVKKSKNKLPLTVLMVMIGFTLLFYIALKY